MSMLDWTIQDFTNELAAKTAVPGGGGASALVGGLGIALGSMVGALTVGKKKYADVEGEMQALMARAQNLRMRLLNCIEKDAVVFEPLAKAYGIPKDDPTRDEVMETCLHRAASVPMEILQLCCDAIDLQAEFAKKGSALAISDAATGVMFCKAALLGAAVNVKVNTAAMKDRGYAETINMHVDKLTVEYSAIADEVYNDVCGRVC